MRQGTQHIGLIAGLALVAGCDRLGGDGAVQSAANASRQWQTVAEYCTECHNRDDLTADIAFDRMTPESVAHEPEIFEAAVRKLRGRQMPPPGGSAARPRDRGWARRAGSKPRSTPPPRKTPIRATSRCIGSIARNTRTPSAICSRWRSMLPGCCRRTISANVSTTSRTHCRFRRRSSSSTSRRPVPWPCRPSARRT